MTRSKRIYEQRIYEGEWVFVCGGKCEGFLVEVAFNDYEDTASEFLSHQTGCHEWEKCELCGEMLQWAGYAGDMPVTEKFLSLIRDGAYMAATVMLAAVTESFISNLVYAAYVDAGLSKEHANRLASRALSRHDSLETVRCLVNWRLRDLAFPVRNLVAHGRAFGENEDKFREDIVAQVKQIREWVASILVRAGTPKRFMPSETERWLLFMDRWSSWLEEYLAEVIRNSSDDAAKATPNQALQRTAKRRR